MSAAVARNIDEQFFDEYDYYNFGTDFDKLNKLKTTSGSGHAKHKKTAQIFNDRKNVTNIQNAEKKEKTLRQRMNSV